MKQLFKVEPSKNPAARRVAERAAFEVENLAKRGVDFQVSIGEIKRTLDQNAAMWPALTDFAKHVGWKVSDRYGNQVPATPEDVKDILTAAFEGETRMAPGLDGGIVILGARTSQYGKRKMGEFLTFLHAEGDKRGVVWSKKAQDNLAEFADSMRRAA